jgi:hypothetical protein
MKLGNFLIAWLRLKVQQNVTFRRKPDEIIQAGGSVYMRRWYILRTRLFCIYAHEILRSDDDRALHDHVADNISIILLGDYIEHRIKQGGVHTKKLYTQGDVVFRRASTAHRLELRSEDSKLHPTEYHYLFSQVRTSAPPYSTLTLFIKGPTIRKWGFHCPNGWRHWKDYLDGGYTKIGKGCD